MRVLRSILAIVVFAAATSATIVNYSQGLLEELDLKLPNAAVIPATVINARFQRTLRRKTVESSEAVTLVADLVTQPPPSHRDRRCGFDLGVTIGGSTFCKLDRIQILVDQVETGKEIMTIGFFFAAETEKPLVVDVTVFNRPTDFDATGRDRKFERWAKREGVATIIPFGNQKLIDFVNGSQANIDFAWLNELLSKGVYKKSPLVEGEEDDQEEYVARPLVLELDTTSKLSEIAQR